MNFEYGRKYTLPLNFTFLEAHNSNVQIDPCSSYERGPETHVSINKYIQDINNDCVMLEVETDFDFCGLEHLFYYMSRLQFIKFQFSFYDHIAMFSRDVFSKYCMCMMVRNIYKKCKQEDSHNIKELHHQTLMSENCERLLCAFRFIYETLKNERP